MATTNSNTGLVELTPPTSTSTNPGTVGGGLVEVAGSGIPSTTSGPAPTPAVPPLQNITPATATGVTADATGYNPNSFNVDSKQTVQGQVGDIISKNSPLIQLADSQANIAMNDRGLVNSSIAQGARESAVIAAALPIAQQDASTYNKAMTDTVNAQNTALSANAQAVNNASTVNAQLLTSLNSTNANAINSALTANQQAANSRAIQLLTNENQVVLANLQTQNQQLLQTNVNAANGFSALIQQIANIQTNPQLDASVKKTDIQSLINNFNQFLKTTAAISSTQQQSVASLNLDQYFSNPTFNGTNGGAPVPATSGSFAGPNGTTYSSQEAANQAWMNYGKSLATSSGTPPASSLVASPMRPPGT